LRPIGLQSSSFKPTTGDPLQLHSQAQHAAVVLPTNALPPAPVLPCSINKKSPLVTAGKVHFLARKQRRRSNYAALQHVRQINIDDVKYIFDNYYL
jgi:hypothetical protein